MRKGGETFGTLFRIEAKLSLKLSHRAGNVANLVDRLPTDFIRHNPIEGNGGDLTQLDIGLDLCPGW